MKELLINNDKKNSYLRLLLKKNGSIISSNIKSILGEGATDEELYSMLIKFLEKLKYEAYLSFRRVNSGVNRKSRKL